MKNDEVTKLFDENTCPEWSRLECFRKGFALASAIRDKEWMAEPVAYVEWTLDEASWYLTYSKAEENQRQEPLFKKPKELK